MKEKLYAPGLIIPAKFYTQLFLYRAGRLTRQFNEIRNTSNSTFVGLCYVWQFVVKRLGYLLRHMRAYTQLSEVQNEIARREDLGGACLAVHLIGGVGDYLMAARFLLDLTKQVEPFSFDVFCGNQKTVAWIFGSVPGFQSSRSEFLFENLKDCYDASVKLGHRMDIDIPNVTSEGMLESPLLRASLCAAMHRLASFNASARQHPRRDNQVARDVVAIGATRMNFAHRMFGLNDKISRYPLAVLPAALERYGLARIAYVTVHNGYDPNVVVLNRSSTKFYPHFADVIALVKKSFPDIQFVQIGTSNSAIVERSDFNLVGRTSLPDVASIIAGAFCHLDVESGLVHMAHCVGTPAAVVFGPTPIDYFGYAENRNVAPHSCGDCWGTQETWMTFCPKGHKTPVCTTQPPAIVAQAIIDSLDGIGASINQSETATI
jgi:hypothetical protein